VARLLDQAACSRGYPLAVRTDNGPEFTSLAWTKRHDIEQLLIEPGEPRSCGRIPPAQFAANHRTEQVNNAVAFNPGLCQ
jgi:putative transposase